MLPARTQENDKLEAGFYQNTDRSFNLNLYVITHETQETLGRNSHVIRLMQTAWYKYENPLKATQIYIETYTALSLCIFSIVVYDSFLNIVEKDENTY